MASLVLSKIIFLCIFKVSVLINISDSNWIQTQPVRKRSLNHLAKLAKWLSCVVSTYLYGADKSLQSINWVVSAATGFFPFNQTYTEIQPSKTDLITRN